MKKWMLIPMLMLALSLTACGQTASEIKNETPSAAVSSTQDAESTSEDQAPKASEEDVLNMEITEIPPEYTAAAEHQGEVVRIDYDTAAESKYAFVYVPYGYSEAEKYDIVYIMHGGGGSQESLFGGEGRNNDIKNAIDHLIENGEMKPILIVTPTFYTAKYNNKGVSGSWDAVREFPEELVNYLMPAVESRYSTYAETTDDAGFTASRDHRAFSGFSMGSVTTWYVFEQCLSYFHGFIPISGDSWTEGMQGGQSKPTETAKTLSDAVTSQGYTGSGFFIYAMTGSRDIAEPMMTAQIGAMKGLDVFQYTDTSMEAGNFTYQVKDGGVHDMPYVKMYLYHALPILYPGQ